MFTPARLRLARQRHGFSLTKFAEHTGIAVRTLSSYENGGHIPPDDVQEHLARTLGVLPGFFHRDPTDMLPPEIVSFRKLSKTTAIRRDAALAAAAMSLELSQWIDSKFVLPTPAIPTLDKFDPETAAEVLRARWSLGSRAIPNLIHLLESKGVRIYAVAPDCREIDAFSFYRDGVPYIFMSTEKSGERQRFDAAHELGHLVLHSESSVEKPQGRDKEMEANRFAAAFLMPADGVLAQSMRDATLDRILAARSSWKVSAMAMTHRLHELGLLTEWAYRSTCVTLAQQGYRSGEPGGIVPETSQILRKVLFNSGLKSSTHDVANELDVVPAELRSHIAGLVPTLA